jgi:hypothetical protein
MALKRFGTSSVRNQLLAGFLVVIAAFAIALVIAINGLSSVSGTSARVTARLSSRSW